MALTKRYQGDDIPKGMTVAVERDGELVGYAKNDVEADEYIRRSTDKVSHQDFFKKKDGGKPFGVSEEQRMKSMGNQMRTEDPRETKQSLRRIEHFRRIFDDALASRATPPQSGPNILYIAWEEFERMHKEYQDAYQAGEHQDFPFQPLSAYARKLKRPDGREIRPIFQNECGVWRDRSNVARICILKDKGPGDMGEKYFSVPEKIDG